MMRVTTLYAATTATTAGYHTHYLTEATGSCPGSGSGARPTGLGCTAR